MAGSSQFAREHLRQLLQAAQGSYETLEARLAPDLATPLKLFPAGTRTDARALNHRWTLLDEAIGNTESITNARSQLLDPLSSVLANEGVFSHNIENLIGTVKLPVGITGPLRVNGLFAKGNYHIPLATTEAALVASYHRGACLLSIAGGCTSILLSSAVSRAPAFAFRTLAESGRFVAWVLSQEERFREITSQNSRYAKLLDIGTTVEANHVYLSFSYSTGDASGQNMVTICTNAICNEIIASSPVKPRRIYVEGNFSGDKKASAQAYVTVRGRKVSAEAVLPGELVKRMLHCSPLEMVDYWRMSAMGGVLSGTMGVQGHFANGLAALYIACGQDPACVAESAVGVTRFELQEDNALYASVTLPSIMVGTVGGGTGLPSQRACLDLIGLPKENSASALAEICAGLILAGELSIIGAMAAGHFARAHRRRARGREKMTNDQ